MSMKRYQNELIVLLVFFLMLGALFYKNKQLSLQIENATYVKQSIVDFKEIIALKKVWADKKTSKKVEKLKKLISASKMKWSYKSKKITASYKDLTAVELNKLITKILELPVEIQKLEIQKTTSFYNVEFKCKW